MPSQHPYDTYFDEALKWAQRAADLNEVPVGAVVVLENKIVGGGHNLKETNHDPCGHAELLALQDAAKKLKSWRLLNCDVYVTLEPCAMCLGAMQLARVKRVIYGANDPKGGAISLGHHIHQDSRLNHRFDAELYPRSDCEMILKEFFRKARSKK